MLTKKRKTRKPIRKSKISNPKIEGFGELEDFLDKKVKLSVKYGKHKSGGFIYGILELAPDQENMYTVVTKEKTPKNKEGGYFFFNEKDVVFAGYLFNSPYPEIYVE